MKRCIPILTILASVLAACDGSSGDGATRDRAPWWLLIVVAGGFVIVLVALVLRGSKRDRPPDLTIWKNNARTGYAQARWLYDAMNEDMAVWRGSLGSDAGQPSGDETSGKARALGEIPKRYDTATDALYRLEASAPDNRTAAAARITGTALRGTRAAFDERAEARLASIRLQAEQGEAASLVAAREHEVRASMHLSERRLELADAIEKLRRLA